MAVKLPVPAANRAEGHAEGRREGEAEGRREGEAEGRREGEAEGRREGEAEVLLRQLRVSSGVLPRGRDGPPQHGGRGDPVCAGVSGS